MDKEETKGTDVPNPMKTSVDPGEVKVVSVMVSKPWWKSKTLRVNLLLLMVAFLTWLAGDQFPFDLGQYGELVAVALAIVNVVLRFMTGQPIALKTNGK